VFAASSHRLAAIDVDDVFAPARSSFEMIAGRGRWQETSRSPFPWQFAPRAELLELFTQRHQARASSQLLRTCFGEISG